MKGNLKGQSGNVVFALGSFILFLLLFEDKLVVFPWLQPVGRIHPLIVHFPIVLLLLALIMEFFRFKDDYRSQQLFQKFSANLLLAGVLTAGLTVIMGIFLSQEEGYNGTALWRHKWSGVVLFYSAWGIYAWREATWYKAPVAKAGAIITIACLIMVGHLGATLTHGENFILQPVLADAEEIVPLEDAVVFDHVIRPIFESKCISCHNAEKLKGRLKLTDSVSIIKGGKTGALFVSGRPDESLMLKRIHLPVGEKKHMPPSGKPQLTYEEMELLHHWIKSGPTFHKKVTALPEGDTLKLVSMRLLERKQQNSDELEFDFPAVAQHKIEGLNSNYRVVTPVSISSPALAVNIYNRNEYTPRTLDELKEVKLQVISLQLSKIPVRDEDIKYITRLDNLRRLNLNFTDVTGKGLKMLSSLKNLRSLSLSGTKIDYDDLTQALPLFETLEMVAIWDTGITPSELSALESRFRHISFIGGYIDDGTSLIKLNPPGLRNKAVVFDDTIVVELYHPVRGVDIRYTTDGSEPDSISSAVFAGFARVGETTAIKARAYKNGWRSSETGILQVYKRAHTPDTAILRSRLNRVHQAHGAQTFFDRELGSFNANSPAWANNWAGVIGNDLELLLKYDTPRVVQSVSLNTLIEPETYLFPPASIEVWGGTSENTLALIGRVFPDLPEAYRKPFIRLVDCDFDAREVAVLRIIAKPVMKLPAWHKRKGRPALLLVDEILIN